MKAINIIGIVMSVAVMGVCFYYLDALMTARWASWDFYNEFDTYYGPSLEDITFEAAAASLLFTLFFIFQIILNLVKVKTITSKVLSIISISLVGIAFFFNLLMLSSPSHISYDEGGQIWILMGIMMLAFSIVFLVQSVVYARGSKRKENAEIIDDIV